MDLEALKGIVAELRCPEAVHFTDRGDDPGRLEILNEYWLYSPESGNKYPIRNGIPVMLLSEGQKWRATPADSLPIPPPEA
jgi:uncharacterized protein YbaR (Trm112 family)